MVKVERSDEQARLGALHAFEILDTAPEEAFDRITRLAKTVLQVPIVLISVIVSGSNRVRAWRTPKRLVTCRFVRRRSSSQSL
jgi:hypothetical protein